MSFRLSYRKRILLYFSVIIAVFTAGIILFEQKQVRHERTKSLENMLDGNANFIHRYIKGRHIVFPDSTQRMDELTAYLSDNLRLTIIDKTGRVMYDNLLDEKTMTNHTDRPEIQKAMVSGSGSNIRMSDSNHIRYLYYARNYDGAYFIRVALPYEVEVRPFLNSKNSFMYFIILFFIVCALMMFYFANKFSKSIKELKDFAVNLKNGKPTKTAFEFPDDEVGEVSAEIVENYNLLKENRRKLALEREKLIQHFQFSEEGIAIFSEERKKIYANSHFLQFLNVIADKPVLEDEYLFSDPDFEEIVAFLDSADRTENVFSTRIEKNGKQFNVRVIIFEDKNFEIYISDITKAEKRRLLKQEMTNNIAHELRTPVTSIRGYLETILNLDPKDVDRQQAFIDRAYVQTIRLSELIQDISMLTKIEEAADRFVKEPVFIKPLLDELESDLAHIFLEKNISFSIDVADSVVIYGSRTLLYSIFRNLVENSIAYAGESIQIVIRCYMETDDAVYFEFYDNGVGVEEKHLVKIFERFYRVNEGRTRDTGGSGLGLSIVKNAVLLHKGNIVAKNRSEGGLLFLITFPKIKA
ncbi:MAG: ATP-binding protein [Petrimonas sp.]|jgi:two-component system OmpR family sensor kinase/two-component system phosphate regulon sensor histidine kinase PhoR|nr:ATP-binding protein [Petrimonas sp.]